MHLEIIITNPKHPHANEEALLEVVDGKVTFIKPFATSEGMVEVDLVNCPHGIQSALVTRQDFRLKTTPKKSGKIIFL